MKGIIFQLDIRDMACLELSDGMSPFFSSPRKPLFLSPCYRLVVLLFFPKIFQKYWKSKSKTTKLTLSILTAQKPLQA